jgi:hypothetical protein
MTLRAAHVFETTYKDGIYYHVCEVCGTRRTSTTEKYYGYCALAAAPKDHEHCQHRTDELRVETCASCSSKKWHIKVFKCAVHKECTIGKKLVKIKCCAHCSSFLEKEFGNG